MPLPAWIEKTRQPVVAVAPAAVAGVSTIAPPAPALKRKLPFTMEQREQSEWCWAAVAVSVAHFYDEHSTLRQCALANAVLGPLLGGTTCCGSQGAFLPCNRPHVVYEPLCKVGHLHDRFAGTIPVLPQGDGYDVQTEVDGERPIVCRIEWDGGFGHFVVLYGYDLGDEEPIVLVADPSNGVSRYAVPAFVSAYRNGTGKWTHTYPTHLNGGAHAHQCA